MARPVLLDKAANDSSTTKLAESEMMQQGQQRKPASSRPKFFVTDSEEEDESNDDDNEDDRVNVDESAAFAVDWDPWASRKVEEHGGDCEEMPGYGSAKNELENEEDDFGRMPDLLLFENQPRFSMPIMTNASPEAAMAATTTTRRPQGMQRRHSLLSDLLMAEKRQHQRQSDLESSPTNSDGTLTIADMTTATPQLYPVVSQKHMQCDRRETFRASYDSKCKKLSPLVRTKRVYRDLAELAKDSSAT
ncbi:hypothetical protein BGZ65_011618, partial [Modicella reniformis]